MSRPNYETGRTSFASRTVFEALDVDDIESEPESEHEVQLPLEPPPPAPAPVTPPKEPVGLPVRSKSSLKRAAKKERAALAAMEPSASALVNGSESVNDHEVEPESTSQTDATESPSGLAPVRSAARARSPARPVDSTTPFSPSLPEDLPQPRSPGLGPRKRKASQDLKSKPLSKESKLEDASLAADGNEKVNVVQLSSLKATSGPINTGADHEKGKRFQQAVTRTIWTLIMIGGFIGLLLAGPVYMVLLVMVCQTLVYREVTALFGLTTKSSGEPPITTKGKSDPWSKTLNWYFFAVTNYFLYGESMIYYFKHVVYADVRFLPFATHHRFISFMLYIFGFMGFVASLKKQYLKQQFGLFGWVHMSLLVIIFSSHFIVNNILEGMIWFWVPASLVICNDVFAYIWGMAFGRTQLIALSPKKTVEGFVGAFISTLIFGFFWATFFMRFQYMTCPAYDLGVSAWSNVQCTPNPVFVWRYYTLPAPFQALITSTLNIQVPPIPWAPFQYHALIMATFASLVAPFGGFFASGFKRAFDIKDFGHSIPGHGGMTDRMDCQFLMGMFSYVYYTSLARVHRVTVGSVLQTIVSSLSPEEQMQLFTDLRRLLEGAGADVAALCR